MRSIRAKNIIIILFLICVPLSAFSCASPPCTHTDVASTVIPPTCTSEGYTHNKCNVCLDEFATDTLPPLGHTITSSIVLPDCENDGHTQSVCTVCGLSCANDTLPALGHLLSTEQTPPTCEDKGFTRAECVLCNYECVYDFTEPTGHDPKATTTHVVSCKQLEGYTVYECSCGFSYTGDYKLYSDIYNGAYVENTTVLAKGIDTSRWTHEQNADGTHAPLDWVAIKEAGFDFAILRAGYIGVKDPVFEEDYAAARAAGAHDFIIKMPDAYNTKIGFGYKDLSGGERQRLSIARAILRNPKILILDEATAAMDTETERKIQAALTELIKGKTTIMIAHRLSTLRDADKLIVIEGGKMVESGTHEELMAAEGTYHRLYSLQIEALKNAGIAE